MIIDSVRKFIKTCPYLQKLDYAIRVNVDYLAKDISSYSIEEVPVNPIIKKYVNGSSKRQFTFIFTSRESYGPDVLQNIDNCGFYEDFANWMEEETDKGNLPVMEEKKDALELKATTTGYAFQTDVDKARYQIQCRLTYLQKQER
ncbi:chloramphenicol resistance protein [Clostridium sp. DL1XJH146]